MSKLEKILNEFSSHEIFWADGHGGDSKSEVDIVRAVEAINKLIIEAKIEELSRIDMHQTISVVSRNDANQVVYLNKRIDELKQSLKDKS